MAIIARNSITLTQVIDISTVTWYYKKQSSISSKPAKPTVADPTSLGWSSDEPTYTEGATDSLYICQKTTFSDGSFDYSDVSLSSSYEAAKLAYNRAVAAQNASDELAPELIVGTHGTAATATWTGRSTVLTSIQAGTKIQYKLSSNGGSNVTLNLTLKDGTTTGAKAVYYLNNTRLGTQYTVGAVINLVYDGSYWRVANPYTNSNTTYTTYSNAVKAGANGVKRYTLLMKDSDNTWTSIVNEANNAGVSGKTAYDSEEGFLLSDVVYSAGGAEYAAGGNTSTIVSGSYSVDLRYSSNGLATKAADATSPLTTYVPVYLVGIIDPSNGKFHLQESGWITQTIPTYEDGKTYIHLGEASSIYQVYLSEQNPAYQFYDGKFRKLSDIETTKAQTAADQAQYDIDHLEIGGRNFALKTAREKVPQLQGSSSVKYVYSSEYEVGSKGKSVIQNGYSSSGTNTFTLSFDTVLTTPTTTGVYTVEVAPYLNGTQGNIETDTFDMREGDAYVCHYSSTFEITSAQKSYSGTFGVKVKFTTNRIAVNGMLFHVRNLKLEKGNRKSDWTPAPEDVEESIEVLKTQIDGKVETWATNEDPASGWSSATDKEAHVGDLWYYTGETKDGRTNNTTYCYTKGGTTSSPTYSWEVYSDDAVDLFDRIDGKKNIFYGAPVVPDATHFVGVADGDYLVDEDGRSYRWDASLSEANKWVLASSVEIGGRNLILDSGRQTANTAYGNRDFYLTEEGKELKDDDDVTFSFKARIASDRTRWGLYNSGGSVGLTGWKTISPDGESDVVYTWSGKWKIVQGSYTATNTYIRLYLGTSSTATTQNIIYWAKLERGNRASDWTPAPEDVDANIQSAVDSVEVGGRNLLRDTAKPVGGVTIARSSAVLVTADSDGIITITPTTDKQYFKWKVNYLDYADYGSGDYTLSCEAMEIDGDSNYTSGGFRFYYGFNISTRLDVPSLSDNYDRYGKTDFDVEHGVWKKYQLTFNVPDGFQSGKTAALTSGSQLTIMMWKAESTLPIKIRNIQLEKGNRATDWSPAPEDLLNGIENLQTQIDGKILTWAQEQNPADNWTSAALKTAHTDDLWYYTGKDEILLSSQSPNITIINNHTYKWDGTKWIAHSASESLFDRIDGKRAIFYGSPNESYGSVDANDLLIDTDGTTYKWVVDEQTPANTGWKKSSDIEIGGRNLLRNTEYPVGGTDIARSAAANVVTEDGVITITSPSDASAYFCWKTGNIGYANYAPGKLTLSFETMEEDGAEGTVSRDIIVRVIVRPLSRVDNAGTSSAHEKYTPPLTPEGTFTHGTWSKRYVTVDVPDDLTSGAAGGVFSDGSIITVQISENSNGKPIKLRRFKLEKGNRATDWTPAPEDTQEAIDAAQAQIDTLQPELIEGTHGTTATDAWTGISQKITALTAGTRIQFKMTSAGVSPVTLNLTLADGTTTGAKSVYFIGTTALGTQYKINAVVDLIYDGESWRVLNPFTDTTTNYYDRTNYKAALAASEVIAEKKLAVMGEDGKLKVLAASKYDVTCPILYVATAYSAANVTAGTTRTTNYSMWGTPFNLATTKSGFTGAAGKSVYIVGTLSGKWFTPDTEVFTVTEPTTENGKAYMLLGTMSTATNAVLNAEHPVYQYIEGKFQRVDQAALIKVAALDTQTGIFNRLTDNGIVQGLFMEKVNGVNQLFINMSYLKTGILRVGGEAIESILFDGSVTVINNNGYDKKTLGAFHLVNEQRYIVVYDSVSYNLNCEYNDIDEYYYIGDGWLIEDIPTAPPDPQFVIYEDTDGVRIKCTAAGTHTVKLIGYEEKDTFYANADTGEVRINGDFESSNGNYTVSIKNALLDMVYSGNSIGSIGMGAFQFRPNNRGISFDLNAAGDFLAWRVNDGENWNYIMAYTRQAFGSFAANHLTFTENINLTNKAAQYVYNPQSAVDAFGRVAYNGTITINGTVYQVSNGMIFSRT